MDRYSSYHQQNPNQPTFNPNLQQQQQQQQQHHQPQLPPAQSQSQSPQHPTFNPSQQAQAQQYAIQQHRLALQQQQQLQQRQQASQQQQPGGPPSAVASPFPNYRQNPAGQINPGVSGSQSQQGFPTTTTSGPASTQGTTQSAGYGNPSAAAMQHAALMQQQMQQSRPAGNQSAPQYYNSAAPAAGIPAPSNTQPQRQSSTGTVPLPPNQNPGPTRPQPVSNKGQSTQPAQNRQPPPNPTVMTSTIATSSAPGSFTTPTSAHAPTQPTSSMPPPPPLTPEETTREKERVGLLFEINQVLLEELVTMQSQGKGGNLSGQPQGANNPALDKPSQPIYGEYMRRLQGNLQYLAADAERASKPADKIPQGPAIMSPPTVSSAEQANSPATSQLASLYSRLQQIFPDWKGAVKPSQNQAAMAAAAASSAQQLPNPHLQQQGPGIAASAS